MSLTFNSKAISRSWRYALSVPQRYKYLTCWYLKKKSCYCGSVISSVFIQICLIQIFDLLRWQEGLTRYFPWSLWDFVVVEICNFKMFWWFWFCTVLVLRGCLFTNFVYSEIHSRYLKFASNNLLKLYNYNLFYISLFSRAIEIPQGKRYRMILVVFFLF